jgi:hypothetical protein
MGGAFLGLAFDASTAFTNPAGLTNISRPEWTLELRSWEFTHVFTDSGRIAGRVPTQVGLDTRPGLRDGEATDDVLGASFLAYVHPWERWSLALYRHELINFEAEFSTQGAYLELTRGRSPLGIPGELDGRLASLRNAMDLEVVGHAVALAYKASPDLSFGLALSYFDFALDSTAERFVPPLFEPPEFRDDQVVNVQRQRGDDDDFGGAAGFLWLSPRRRWSVGGVYRQGPDFAFRATSERGPATTLPFVEADQRARFHAPDVYGVGLALQATDRLRFALDVDRVEYSDLLDDFLDIFDLAELFPGRDPELDRFEIDDGTELHLGGELAFYQAAVPFFLRAGAWNDPDHSLRFEGANPGFGAVFRPRGDDLHLALGVGIVLPRLQLDLAADLSDRVDTWALSTVVRY